MQISDGCSFGRGWVFGERLVFCSRFVVAGRRTTISVRRWFRIGMRRCHLELSVEVESHARTHIYEVKFS